jgi:dihydroorotase-like cyclic amidohydrolase
VSVDPNAGDLQRGDILIDGSQFLAVSCSIAAEDAEIIDVSNRLLAVHGVQRVFRTRSGFSAGQMGQR